jgi:hypothetical protein
MTANDSDRVGKAPHLVSGMHGAPPMAWPEVLSRENDHDLKVLWLYNACVSGAWRSGTFVFFLLGSGFAADVCHCFLYGLAAPNGRLTIHAGGLSLVSVIMDLLNTDLSGNLTKATTS